MNGRAAASLRLLMTGDAIGGVWQYALELAGALGRRGAKTLLALTGPAPSGGQRAAAAGVPGLTLAHAPFRLEWMADGSDELASAGRWLLDLERDFSADVVHANSYAHAALPWRAPVLLAAHSCVRTWWRAVHGCDCPPEWAEYVQVVGAGLAAADLVVTPSGAFKCALEATYGRPRASRVIYNGRSATQFSPGAKQPLIFAAGRAWDEGKNLRVLNRLSDRVDWPVYIAGPLESPDGVQAEVGPRCRHLGPLDEAAMARWFGCAAIFASPARYEPFGLAVLEAALAGCALVLADIATFRELWDECALFVDPDDRDDLECALARLITDIRFRNALTEKARARANAYGPARMAEAYLESYRDLCEAGAGGRLGARGVAPQIGELRP